MKKYFSIDNILLLFNHKLYVTCCMLNCTQTSNRNAYLYFLVYGQNISNFFSNVCAWHVTCITIMLPWMNHYSTIVSQGCACQQVVQYSRLNVTKKENKKREKITKLRKQNCQRRSFFERQWQSPKRPKCLKVQYSKMFI